MSVPAEVLRNLHRIHRQLSDLGERRDRGPKQIKAHDANVKRLEDELAQAKAASMAARKAVDDKQLQLRSKEDKLVQLQNKLSSASTNREYQALQEQISADKVAASVLEDEILEALGKIDESKAKVVLAEEAVAKGREEAAKTRAAVEEQRKLILADIERLEVELKEVETLLPAEFREVYDRIVRAKGEDALAEVEGEHCGGCYQRVTPNIVAQLTMGKAIACNSCGRLLYLKGE